MSSHKKITLAICGLGGFAKRRILPALASCPNIELVAVVDRSMTASELSPSIMRFNSLDDLLESNLADSVYISTPNYLHCQQTLQCLVAGRHVLCEKPMAMNSRDCEAMLLAAQKSKLQLTVGHMLRYSPALQEVRRWLQSGMLEKPRSIDVSFCYDLPEGKRPWAFRKEFSGGGALMDAGVHCIDTVRFLVGDPVIALEAQMDSLGSSGIDRVARCRFTAAGVFGLLGVCSNAPYSSSLTICGDEGQIVVDGFAACWDTVPLRYISFEKQSLNQEVIVDVSSTYARQLQAFADVILTQNVNYRSSMDALENIKIIEKLYEIGHSFK